MRPMMEARKTLCFRVKRKRRDSSSRFMLVAHAATAMLVRLIILPMTPPAELADAMNPVLMASANSAGGVMGKMISLTSIAVAACATNMKREDESLLFRFTLKHSVFLASIIGLIVVFYAYVMPGWAP